MHNNLARDFPTLEFEHREANHHLRIVVSGDTCSAYVDGAVSPLTTLTTALFAAGAAGLYDFSPTNGASSPLGQTFDNFVISTSEVPLPPALALYATGLGLMGLLGWRRRRTRAAASAA